MNFDEKLTRKEFDEAKSALDTAIKDTDFTEAFKGSHLAELAELSKGMTYEEYEKVYEHNRATAKTLRLYRSIARLLPVPIEVGLILLSIRYHWMAWVVGYLVLRTWYLSASSGVAAILQGFLARTDTISKIRVALPMFAAVYIGNPWLMAVCGFAIVTCILFDAHYALRSS